METEERYNLVVDGAQEVITEKELREVLESKEKPSAYVGYEPSGYVHIGWLIITWKVKQLIKAGFKVDILLADWHAFINDKFEGDMEKIKDCGNYFIDCYRAYGLSDAVENGSLRFRWASDLCDSGRYWERVLRIAKSSSLSRIRRAMTIMGRKEDGGDMDSSKFLYPSMQAADIFELGVDVAIGGMDQRHAHMLARDVADKLGWRKPTAIHTPLISGLSRGGRMEMTTGDTGGLDHEELSRKVASQIDELARNETLSEVTRNLLNALRTMKEANRIGALEALFSEKRAIEQKAAIYSIIQKSSLGEEAVINGGNLQELANLRNHARKELLNYLGIQTGGPQFEMKMSKSDPDSGIYLHDREEDIRRKIKKAWCPEGFPDNPLMEICQHLVLPIQGHLHIVRPEKWGGDLHFEDIQELRRAFSDKRLHPADLKKAVADSIVEILRPFREYFKAHPENLDRVKRHARSIGR